jgi:hypothetical protein
MGAVPTDRRTRARPDDPERRGRRAEPRAYLLLPASTQALSGHRHVTLLDVSRTGARLQGADLPEPGKDILIKCVGIEAFGTVAWAVRNRCGIHFDEPLGGRDLVALRHIASSAERSEMTLEERQAAADWANGLAR